MSAPRLFDVGLQPERTLLAWRRTCLALAAAVLVVVKVMALESDAVTVALACAGLGLPVLAWTLATVRYGRVHRELTGAAADPVLPPAGSAVLMASMAALSVGILAMILIIL